MQNRIGYRSICDCDTWKYVERSVRLRAFTRVTRVGRDFDKLFWSWHTSSGWIHCPCSIQWPRSWLACNYHQRSFFCILMIITVCIDFQFYVQLRILLHTALTTPLLSLTLTYTYTCWTPLHHLFYIVNNFFSHIRTAAVPVHVIVLCICPILYCELTFYY